MQRVLIVVALVAEAHGGCLPRGGLQADEIGAAGAPSSNGLAGAGGSG